MTGLDAEFQELLEGCMKGARTIGTFDLPALLRNIAATKMTGIAAAKEKYRELYIGFQNGEPEGSVYIDSKGILFGDRAASMLKGQEQFVLYEVSKELTETFVMRFRMYDKNRLKKSITHVVPEFGKKRDIMGTVTVKVTRGGVPQNGVRVSIRKDGIVVGSDISTMEGTVGFRVLLGEYECIIQERTQETRRFVVRFDESHTSANLEL